MSAVIPLIIASQNGTLNISPTSAFTIAFISLMIVFYLCFATIYYGGQNKENLKKDDLKNKTDKAWLSMKLVVLYHH